MAMFLSHWDHGRPQGIHHRGLLHRPVLSYPADFQILRSHRYLLVSHVSLDLLVCLVCLVYLELLACLVCLVYLDLLVCLVGLVYLELLACLVCLLYLELQRYRLPRGFQVFLARLVFQVFQVGLQSQVFQAH